MSRPILLVLLSAALLTQACATSQPTPPAVSQELLLAKMAERAKGDEPTPCQPEPNGPDEEIQVEDQPSGSGIIAKCMVVSLKISATCLVLGSYGALAMLSRGGGSGTGSGIGNLLVAIWSAG